MRCAQESTRFPDLLFCCAHHSSHHCRIKFTKGSIIHRYSPFERLLVAKARCPQHLQLPTRNSISSLVAPIQMLPNELSGALNVRTSKVRGTGEICHVQLQSIGKIISPRSTNKAAPACTCTPRLLPDENNKALDQISSRSTYATSATSSSFRI